MPVLTILTHGTCNASSGKILGDPGLVISRLEQWMVGAAGGQDTQWMINQGVGTWLLNKEQKTMPGWTLIGGIVWGKGIEEQVEAAIKFVKPWVKKYGANNVTVNLAGHSRGSITCMKIAHHLQEKNETKGCPVNMFLIDPVPGNMGCLNNGVYRKIAIEGNVKKSYMILAENERRNSFRAVIDNVFLQNMPQHQMDTIPGNHGGINETGAVDNESANVVLHHAVKFLVARGSEFNHGAATAIKTQNELLELYAQLMLKYQSYEAQGSRKNNTPFRFVGGVSSAGDRNVETKVKENRSLRIGRNIPFLEKNKYRGQGMKGLNGNLGALKNGFRFFANFHHRQIFGVAYPNAFQYVKDLEVAYQSK
jgi:hypothetical protein